MNFMLLNFVRKGSQHFDRVDVALLQEGLDFGQNLGIEEVSSATRPYSLLLNARTGLLMRVLELEPDHELLEQVPNISLNILSSYLPAFLLKSI